MTTGTPTYAPAPARNGLGIAGLISGSITSAIALALSIWGATTGFDHPDFDDKLAARDG